MITEVKARPTSLIRQPAHLAMLGDKELSFDNGTGISAGFKHTGSVRWHGMILSSLNAAR
jgi:hypothetical protein